MTNSKIPILTLNNGIKMPALGFGTFAKEDSPGTCYKAVLAALDAGYRHLDCASYYKNEEEVGSALHQWLANNPKVTREDIFITTKVWPHMLKPEDVEISLDESLRKLGVEYVDAFLIHWPFAVERTEDYQVKMNDDGKYILKPELTANLEPTWRKFEEIYERGKTRSIGVSNYRISDLTALLSYAVIPPAINQIELHPYLPSPALVAFCRLHNIVPVAYSPLGSQHQCPSKSPKLMEDDTIKKIAREKGVDVAQILISWGLRKGWGVLPKSSDARRITRNFQVVELSVGEMKTLDEIEEGKDEGRRFVNPVEIFGFDFFVGDVV